MMLTAGIEFAEGKSSFAELGALAAGGAEANAGVPKPAPVVVMIGGDRPDICGDAAAEAPPFCCHANACVPSEFSKARLFMLATTRAGSCSSRSSAQSAPLQPRVAST